jgi:PAS domain S-box-containing protein
LNKYATNHGVLLAGLLVAAVATAPVTGIKLVEETDETSHSHVSFFVPLLAAAIASAAAVFWHRRERFTWALLGVGLALGAAAESGFPHTHGEVQAVPLGAAVAYGVFCAASGATVLAASGNFQLRRSFAQGLGVCALGLATLWTWAFLAPAAAGGSESDVIRSALDLLLALAILGAICNHGWPTTARFSMLAGGLFLLAFTDSLEARGGIDGEALGFVLDALPFVAAALVAAVACVGLRVDSRDARSGRLVVTVSLLAMATAIAALVVDHYTRLSSGTILLATATLLVGALQLVVAQRGWRDARAQARLAEITSAASEFVGLDAALTVGTDCRVLACNDQACRVFRRERIEIVGKHVDALVDGLPGGGSFHEVLADASPEGLPTSIELNAYDSHGVGFPVEVAVGPRLGDSLLRNVLVRDISERRRRDEENRRLAEIIRASEDAVLTKDLHGTITAWNQGAEKLYGYSPAEAIGTDVGELLIPPERRDEQRRVLEEVGRGETISFETQRRTKDGSLIDVSLRAFPIHGLSGEVTAVCTVGHDVSDRRRRERAEERDQEAQLWRRRLREALDDEGLLFHAQPIIDLADGAVHHHELLVRMQLKGQLIRPGVFLPYAEESELIRDMDLWAVENGIRVARDLPVAINLSARSLGSRGLLGEIERCLGEEGASPGNLIFEITETAAAENMEGARELVRELTRLGCDVALDDFGTGYGSFTYLRHLPVTQLKIDMEFIRGICSDAADRRVVESMVAVARNFEMNTVAEGVEDRETFELLGDLGIDLVQGYYLGRPQPLDVEAVKSGG